MTSLISGAEIVTVPDPEAVAAEAAGRLVQIAAAAHAARGRFTMALAGGSTPAHLYRLLVQQPYRDQIDWLRTFVFFSDERCVPLDDPASNYRMAYESLLAQAALPPEQVFPMPVDLPGEKAAEQYAELLGAVAWPDPRSPGGPAADSAPRLDLILLGMGDDGHTASLFPTMPVVAERQRYVVWTSVPDYARPAVPRLTLTLPVLNAARHVLFLVTGANKAKTVAQVLSGARSPNPLPAALVQPHDGRLTWLLDRAAAGQLNARGEPG